MKISVIIPVYNSEKFLNRCLDSVLGQTLLDIEIICIDDCSTDNSFFILKKYAETDSRVKCFKNEINIGQGLTRNKGIDIARGEYIAFVDSDDWIEPNMYEVLYSKTITEKYDLICCNLTNDFPDGSSRVPEMPAKELITIEFLINESIAPSIKFFSPNSPCDKIYKRESIEKLKLRFESERTVLYEDKIFNLIFLASNPSFYFESKVLYHYMIRYGSTMTSYRKNFIARYFLMDQKVRSVLKENDFFYNEINQRLRLSLLEITFVFCLNELVYNKSIKGKILGLGTIFNDKRISSNTKFFTINEITSSSTKINAIVKSVCFIILKYLR